MRLTTTILSPALIMLGLSALSPVHAAECTEVTLSDPGWTDIASTNALATTVLGALGYETNVQILAVPVGFQSLANGDTDVFLGNWMPSQSEMLKPHLESGAVEGVRQNLAGAKFTLAVNREAYEAGVKDFADLAKHADRFDSEIYGIEAGASANVSLTNMIDANDFGLAGWKLVESSEQAMLSQVKRKIDGGDWIVFLAWEPHPMNTNFDINYLTGGDEYFGPDFGGATVHTLARKGFADECPNVTRLLNNLAFTLDLENQMMGLILDDGLAPEDAAKQWLKSNPRVLDLWLANVTTADGEPGLAAVQAQLGL